MIEYISKITIYVEDQEKAKEFWTQKVDFAVKFEQTMGPVKWLEVGPANSATTFVLYDKASMKKQNPLTNTGHPSVILSTKDIQTAYDTMKQRGVQADNLDIMPYGKMLIFYDPDGNPYLLREDQ